MHLTAIYWCSFHFPVTQIVGPRALHARLHILAGSPSLIRNDTPWTRARRTAQERRAGAGTLHTRFTFYSLAASNCRCRKHLLASSVTTIEMYKQRGEPNVSQRARKASPTPKIASRHSSFVVDSTLHHTASQLPLAKQADGTAAHDTQDTHCHERPPLTVAASHRRRLSPSPLLTVTAPHRRRSSRRLRRFAPVDWQVDLLWQQLLVEVPMPQLALAARPKGKDGPALCAEQGVRLCDTQ